MQLGLGTVQFGLDYGVSNEGGRTPGAEVRNVLGAARRAGIEVLDTAAAYGASERVLGESLAGDGGFRIVTKSEPGAGSEREGLRASLERSLGRLGRDGVYGFMVHHAKELLGQGGDAVYAELAALKAEGLAGNIGVSVYGQAQVDAILARFDIDVIQVPVNVFDQRLARSGCLARLKARRVEIHVRSIFLQGLVFMEPDAAPAFFEPVRERLAAWHANLGEAGLTPAQGALAYARTLAEPDVVLVGVNSAAQLDANVRDFALPDPGLDFSVFAIEQEEYITPSLWRLEDR